jgi:hypothetical protein
MPIRHSERGRYPENWKAISLARREAADWRCEGSPRYPECRAENGKPHPVTGSIVVLTVAHLGLPASLPFFLHVTRYANADEIFEAVGLFMPTDPKCLEWRSMMHHRALSQFVRGPEANGASFFIAAPSSPTCLSPRRSVIYETSSAPIWIRLTTWRQLGEPFQSTTVCAETASGSQMKPTNLIRRPATFADPISEAALGPADAGTGTWVGARPPIVSGLLTSKGEGTATDDTVTFAVTLSGRAALPWRSTTDPYRSLMIEETLGRACLPVDVFGIDGEHSSARAAEVEQFGFSGTRHGCVLYHIVDYPENCDQPNLRAWCQRCHLAYDAPMHATGRQARAKAARADADLFESLPA